MKFKLWEKAIVIINVVLVFLLVCFVLQSFPVYAATSSGNTTVYDYDTNETLVAQARVDFLCNATGLSATLTLDVDPYVGTNEKELVKAYY